MLGGARRHEFDAKYGIALLNLGLGEAMAGGVIEEQPVEPLSRLILGALMEASTVLASADDSARARRDVGAAFDRLLDGLARR